VSLHPHKIIAFLLYVGNGSGTTFARAILEFLSTRINTFSGLSSPKRKIFVSVSFSMAHYFGGTGWGQICRQTDGRDGTLLLYTLNEDCCKGIDNTAPDHASLLLTQILDVRAL
jgi:hypothetical protein